VSYQRIHEYQTKITVYLDGGWLAEFEKLDWWPYDYGDAADGDYKFIIGRDVPGVVRKAKLNHNAFCGDDDIPVVQDRVNCLQKGNYPCNYCDYDELNSAGTYDCFWVCDDLSNYVTNGKCNEGANSCRYVKDTSNKDYCYRCNQTAGFIYNEDVGKTS